MIQKVKKDNKEKEKHRNKARVKEQKKAIKDFKYFTIEHKETERRERDRVSVGISGNRGKTKKQTIRQIGEKYYETEKTDIRL